MERGSDKHAPLVDDRMKDESEPLERGAPTSGRVEEFRDTEGPAERTGAARDDVEMRSAIARSLHRVDYPAERDVLIEEARRNNAPLDVIDALSRLPDGETYANAQDIWLALGGSPEERS